MRRTLFAGLYFVLPSTLVLGLCFLCWLGPLKMFDPRQPRQPSHEEAVRAMQEGLRDDYPPDGMQGADLARDVNEARLILCGTFKNARAANPNNPGDLAGGTTDLVIEKVIKPHKIVENKKLVTLDKYVPKVGNTRFLIFCDVVEGKIDAYRSRPIKKNSDLPAYLVGILKVKDEKPRKRLRFYFDYLNHAEPEIANDALRQFTASDYKDYRDLAGQLPGDRLAAWLRHPYPGAYHRIGLFARLLGHCSKDKEQDAQLLRRLLNDPLQQSGVDGLLEGLMLLQPKAGWQDVCKVMEDASTDFARRYAALKAVRFVKEYRPDLVPSEELIKEVAVLLDQLDIADLAIEDLRKWKVWELTDRILGLKDKESHDIPIIRRAILRFSLSSPRKAAKVYVEEQRKRDEQSVLDAEELLKIEQQNTQTPRSK